MFVDAGAAQCQCGTGILWATNGLFFGSSGFFTAIKRKKNTFNFFYIFTFFVKVLSQVKQCFNKGSAEQSPSV